MNHTFSYMKEAESPRLVRRPWWAFWRHDELVVDKIQRRYFFEVSEEQADWVKENFTMLHSLFGWHHMCLEGGAFSMPYIPTSGGAEKSQ